MRRSEKATATAMSFLNRAVTKRCAFCNNEKSESCFSPSHWSSEPPERRRCKQCSRRVKTPSSDGGVGETPRVSEKDRAKCASASSHSVKCPSESEFRLYPEVIAHCARKGYSVATDGSASQAKVISVSSWMSIQLKVHLDDNFWEFYVAMSLQANHKVSSNPAEFLAQWKHVEFDFVGYLDPLTISNRELLVPVGSDDGDGVAPGSPVPLGPDSWRKVSVVREQSPPEESRCVALFELTSSAAVGYKLAQLEVRLVAYKLHREAKSERRTSLNLSDVVGLCGVVVPSSTKRTVERYVNSGDFPCKHIMEMKRLDRFHILCPGQVPEVTIDDIYPRAVPEHVIPFFDPTAAAPRVAPGVWVQLLDSKLVPHGSAFEVTPAKNHIDGLKDAIKAKWDANMPEKANALLMRIFKRDADGRWVEETRASGKLSSNTEDFPYGFVLE